MDALDGFFDDEPEPEYDEILFMGSQELITTIEPLMDNLGSYRFHHVEKREDLSLILLKTSFTFAFIENTGIRDDLISLTSSIRKNQTLVRIILFTQNSDVQFFSDILNYGDVDGVQLLPITGDSFTGLVVDNEARYTIAKSVTAFVSEPPELSKASFLLLDPTLEFQDEGQPLNFVGLMITAYTVPQYTVFFEETLAQDEVLFAGYLSSISILGDDLFNSKESLKEINFGGISVLFRFYQNCQFSFFVKNLNRGNISNAEQRVDSLVNNITEKYGEDLNNSYMTEEMTHGINEMTSLLDKEDENELLTYERERMAKIVNSEAVQKILIFGKDENRMRNICTQLNELSRSDDIEYQYQYDYVLTEEKANAYINDNSCAVIIIDSERVENEKRILEQTIIFSETDLLMSIILLEREPRFTPSFIDGINKGRINYVLSYQNSADKINEISMLAFKDAIKNQELSELGDGRASGNLNIAKSILRDHLESFDESVKPELLGVLISDRLDPIYQLYWEINGEVVQFEPSMLAGLITSLKSIGTEMFTETEEIAHMEIKGSNVIIQSIGNFLFVYFVRNLSVETTPVIEKEIHAVTAIYNEMLTEAYGVIPTEQLIPLFDQIANKAQQDFMHLLS